MLLVSVEIIDMLLFVDQRNYDPRRNLNARFTHFLVDIDNSKHSSPVSASEAKDTKEILCLKKQPQQKRLCAIR